MERMKAINTNEVARYAAKNMVKNNSDILTATAKAIELETLKKRMMRGEVVRFAYKKLNGEIRVAVGTLQKDAVEATTNGNGTPKRFFGMFAYIDLEKMSWRGFKEEKFIGVIES